MRPAPTSFSALAERHRSEILSYLVRLLGNGADAEDACQEVFLRAQRAFERLEPNSNTRAWLYRIATNCGLNAARGRARRTGRNAAIDPDTLPAATRQSLEGREDLRTLAVAVRALPARQRAALMLRQFHDLGYADIAATLGGSEAAARANVYQAIKRLRARLVPRVQGRR